MSTVAWYQSDPRLLSHQGVLQANAIVVAFPGRRDTERSLMANGSVAIKALSEWFKEACGSQDP